MPAIALYCDSEATMSKTLNKVYHSKSSHMSLRHTCIRQILNDSIVTIIFVRTYNNLADPLTKSLARDLMNSTTSRMGLKPFV